MEISKAIEIINRQGIMKTNPKTKSQAEIREALQCFVVEVEKNIPKQVIHGYHCPKCGSVLPAEKFAEDDCSCCFKWKYCPSCGQALKWE